MPRWVYVDLGLDKGDPPWNFKAAYLFAGHGTCYGRCKYSFFSDFVPGLLMSKGGRTPNERITAAKGPELFVCMNFGGCLR